MDIYYMIVFFMFGAVLGSFYNVVGYRIPKGESLIYPSSHCTNCGHKLRFYELVPIFSFLFLRGKCSKCKQKISWFYTIFEFITAVLFVISYIVFKNNIMELIIALTFVSLMVIICVSDFNFMIIPDSVLLVFAILILIELSIMNGLDVWKNLVSGLLSFGSMFLIKLLGDFLFKKESMGGGDIKLMFVIGMVLGWTNAMCSIFFGSLVGLPIAILILLKNKNHELPFGPLLAAGALIILFIHFDVSEFVKVING